jgi:hypothetical protein
MKRERFYEAIEIRGINPYIYVKAEIANRLKLGWRKPMPVSVRINGQPRKGMAHQSDAERGRQL